MKIEDMKFPFECKTEGGDTAVVLGVNEYYDVFVGYLKGRNEALSWHRVMGYPIGAKDFMGKDNLIIPQPLTVGKHYLTTDGERVYVVGKMKYCSDGFPFVVESPFWTDFEDSIKFNENGYSQGGSIQIDLTTRN